MGATNTVLRSSALAGGTHANPPRARAIPGKLTLFH
jgi:hypothetical protein